MFKFKKNKKKKSYFNLIFISFSILAFFLLLFALAWFKNALYEAKDQVALEFIKNYEENQAYESVDSLMSSRVSSVNDSGKPIDTGKDPSLGEKDATVKIFYFSDFSCSFCLDQADVFENIYNEFKPDVRIIWKDYPNLSSLDSFSYQAARAARCAQKQDSFWEYKDLLKNSSKDFLSLAEEIDLNLEDFSDCLSSFQVDEAILNNVHEAENLDIVGVPYIYVNDKGFLGSFNEDDLKEIIETELNK